MVQATLSMTDRSLLPAPLAGGHAIASSDGAGSPERAFDGDPATFWVSAERGTAVKMNSWVGYAFADPQSIGQVHLVQTNNPAFRQDRVWVQASRDDGASWENVISEPANLHPDSIASITLPPQPP